MSQVRSVVRGPVGCLGCPASVATDRRQQMTDLRGFAVFRTQPASPARQFLELLLRPPKLVDPFHQLSGAPLYQVENVGARCFPPIPVGDDLSDLPQTESQTLCTADELESLNCRFVEVPVTVRGSRRGRHETHLFVVPDRLGGHLGSSGELSNQH
jgi:hypothetical protein